MLRQNAMQHLKISLKTLSRTQHLTPTLFANYNCLVKDVNKDDEPLILPSAFKHGVSENDILHAWREARGPVDINYDRDPPTYMYVGPGVSGAVWYEIGTASRAGYDVELIVHAMKARKGYLRKEGLR